MTPTKYTIQEFLEVKSSHSPQFSPDATKVAYLSNMTGTSQLYLLNRGTGAVTQLTEFPDPISNYLYSPTDETLIFTKAEGGNENTQIFKLDIASREITTLTNNPKSRYNFGSWSNDGTRIAYASNERNGTDFDVYIHDLTTSTTRCVYDRGGWVGPAGFSPRDTYLALREYTSNVNYELYLFDTERNIAEHLTPHKGTALYGSPRWLKDESAFYLRTDEDQEFIGVSKYDLAAKRFTKELSPLWDIEGLAINKEGTQIVLNTNENGYSKVRLYECPTLTELDIELPPGEISNTRFSHDGSSLIYDLNSSTTTTDVWITDLHKGTSQQITRSPQGVPKEELVEPKLITWNSFDGLQISGFLFSPLNSEGKQLPTIINIHGGPEGQFRPGPSMLTQYFVHHGYRVIAPNVRGSTGYGKTFLTLDDVEKRLDSLKDIVALREYLLTHDYSHPDQIVLMGGSYGGFMVLAGLAFYPDLWAAGVDIVGIVNFVTFLENTAPYRRALREAEYGSLSKHRALLEALSPIHSVENITAPLLVIHGANDPRVPLSEAEQVRDKLIACKRKVELLVYHDEGHGLSKLKNRLDAYPKVAEFLSSILDA